MTLFSDFFPLSSTVSLNGRVTTYFLKIGISVVEPFIAWRIWWKETNKPSFNRKTNYKKIQEILKKAAVDLASIETIWQNQDKDPDEVETILQNLVEDTNKEEPKQDLSI